jgi:hypothetical protein
MNLFGRCLPSASAFVGEQMRTALQRRHQELGNQDYSLYDPTSTLESRPAQDPWLVQKKVNRIGARL